MELNHVALAVFLALGCVIGYVGRGYLTRTRWLLVLIVGLIGGGAAESVPLIRGFMGLVLFAGVVGAITTSKRPD